MKGITKILLFVTVSICLQGCTFLHRFEIKNPTDQIWNVEYEIYDARGVFRNKIAIKNPKMKKDQPLVFQGNVVSFSLKPNETASLFWLSNTCYKYYKDNSVFDELNPWKGFINVKNIKLSSGEDSYVLDPSSFERYFDKKRRSFVRINIKKVIEYFAIPTS